MTCYSMEPRDQIFLKGYEFSFFAKNMGKTLSDKYCQKRIDHVKQFGTETIKTVSKRAIQKRAEAASHLIGNEIAKKIIKVSKSSHRIL